jgi:hypothetical protein
MSAHVPYMSKVALANTDEDAIKEGEYETQFGKVVVRKTDDGYKIIVYINGRKLGRQLVSQIAYSLIGSYIARERTA